MVVHDADLASEVPAALFASGPCLIMAMCVSSDGDS